MLYDSENYVDPAVMMRELLAAVRDTNRRLFEIKNMIVNDYIAEEKKDEVKGRYLRLMNTRFCLIYSIYDMRQKFVDQISDPNTKEMVESKFQLDGLFQDLSHV